MPGKNCLERSKMTMIALISLGVLCSNVVLALETSAGASGDSSNILECKKVTSAIKIDGNLSDWKGRPSIKLGKENIFSDDAETLWKGENDLSAEAYIGWDDNNFYFACYVKDDTYVNNQSGDRIWDGDCLQVGFDALNNAVKGDGYQQDDYEYGFALTKKGLEMWRWYGGGEALPAGIKYTAKPVKGGMIYEIAFPQNSLAPLKLEKGKMLGFNFTINEADTVGGAREYFMQLTPGLGEKKDLGWWRDVILVK